MEKTRLSSRIWSVALCLCMVLSLMPGIPLVAKAAGTEGMITIEMTDSYGDGWNGNAIEIYVDGELVDTATIAEQLSSGIWTCELNPHATYTFKWVKEIYASETSFVIYVGTEQRLSASGSSYSTGDEIWIEAAACAEPVYENGVCTNCGAACVHQMNDAGLCSVCGYQCFYHIFSDGVCGICGGVCSHSVTSEGVCGLCGQTLNLTIDMTAKYSYGWNQCAQITVFADGTEIGVAELVNVRSGSWSVPYDSMTTYTFHWTPESWPWECTFTIKIGDVEYYAADNDACDDLAEGVFFTIESRCPHDSFDEDYICTICGKSCGHKAWTDSVCGVCGFTCGTDAEHDWDLGTCKVCSVTCNHSFTDYVCDTCGLTCGTDVPHSFGGDVECDACGFVCGTDSDHVWNMGVCTVCAAVCPHERYEAGLCTNCGYYESAVQNGTGDNGFALYEIYNASQLLWFADYVNTNEVLKTEEYIDDGSIVYKYTTTASLNARLMADIDLTGFQWKPLGVAYVVNNSYEVNGYNGVFDGNGHTISGLEVTVVEEDHVIGFFGRVGGATIRNLAVEGSIYAEHSTERLYVGGLVGYVFNGSNQKETVIENCSFTGSVAARANTQPQLGGLGGHIDSSSVTNCIVSATLICDYEDKSWTGAIVGLVKGSTYSNCYFNSTICDIHASGNEGAIEGVTGVTAEVLASGKIAYKLGEGWGQTIGTDAYPIYGGAPVYQVTTGCATYSNTQKEVTEKTHVGTATCTAAAVCEDCGESFGEALGHSELTAATCKDRAVCGVCGESYGELTDHQEFGADAKCTVCGEYEMPKQNGTGDNGFALYEIENASQLLWFADYVNSGEILKTHIWNYIDEEYYTYYTTNCVNAKLMADIDMTGLPWSPIGRYDIDRNYYTGVFDGNGHTVSGIDCTVTSDNNIDVGFFGEFSGTVKNLTVQGSFKGVTTATNKRVYAGGIAGYCAYSCFDISYIEEDYAYPVIENCAFIGSVSTEANYIVFAGGIAGMFNRGTMTNCLAAATVTSGEVTDAYTGALVGSTSSSTFTNCYYDSTLCSLNACGDGEIAGVTGLATEAFADGSVAYALGFGQTLGTDTYPTYGDDAVYQVTNCKNETAYSNTNERIGHQWKDGICSVCYEQCSHIGGEATCTEQAVCQICGASYGETLGHDVNVSGVCIRCGGIFPFRVDEAGKYFATINEACTYAVSNMSSYTITVLSDAQVDVAAVDKLVINPGVTLTVNGKLTVSGLKKDGNVAGDGVVIVGDTEYKIFDNDLYRYAGAADVNWEIWNVEFPTYWTAGEGYAAFNPDTQVLTLHNATIYAESYSSDDAGVVYKQDLTINFSGTNTLTTNDHNSGTVLYCEGKTVMNGIGQDAVLNLYSGYRSNNNNGEVRAVRITNLTVNSGTVNVVSGNGIGTFAISGTTLTVAEGAVVNANAGNGLDGHSVGVMAQKLTVEGTLNATSGSCGSGDEAVFACDVVVVGTPIAGNGTINGLCMVVAEYIAKVDYIACGNATLNHDHILRVLNSGVPSIFTVPEGATLTIAKGVTLDMSVATEIDFSGTVVNNGTIILPANYDINNAPKSGTVVIGDNRFTWNGQKWVCADESQHTGGQASCSELAICELCGESYGDYDSYNHAGETYVEYEWYPYSDGTCYVYATLYCAECDGYIDSNSDYAEQTGTVEATDCLNPGSVTYSVTVTLNGDEYTDTKTYPLISENHVGEPVNGFCSACGGYEAAVWNEEKGVYEISNAGQLYWYAQYLNTTNAEVYAELTADIVIPENAPNWEPINASYVYFNGNFHTISGLKCIGDENMTYVGLFGCEGWWYEISNLHITDSYFEGSQYVGAVVACMTNGGSVTNCAVTNTTVKGDYYAVGGLIGNLSSSHAINCFSTATVIGAEGNVLIGSHSVGYGSIENCYFLGTEDNYDGTTAMTAEDFASGKVAYLLQSTIQGEDIYDEETGEWIGTAEPELIWGQTIGEDAFPVFGSEKVYQITDCDGETGYRNVNVSGHIFKDATCTAPKTCKVCGETEGEALGHKWAAATCTAPKTCSVCGATEGDALGHDWIDATCTTPKTCDICGETEGDALGHSYDNGFCVRCDDYEAATGSGTAADPYKIGNAGQLYWFAAQINGGNTGIYGQLTADIVVNTNVLGADFALNEGTYRSWTPIGSNAAPYTGTFDGKEFTISGLYFEQGGQMYIGLFGRSKGTIQNVGVKDSFFYASSHIGAIAGCNDGTIRNCFNSGYLCGNWNVAGIVGMNYGNIVNCRNSGKIVGDWKGNTNPQNSQIGGIAGYSDVNTLITDCRNTGDISGKNEVGGIVGKYYMMLDVHGTGSVSGCYNSGNVTGAENNVGGIVGEASVNITDCHNSGNICGKTSVGGIQGQGTVDLDGEPYYVTDCSNLGAVTGTGSDVGGISGYGYYTLRCFNSGAITGNRNVGGITGCSYLDITNCYNTGSVSGVENVGGIAGQTELRITNCYNTGVITAETNAGAIVGHHQAWINRVYITNCYYLTGTAAVGFNGDYAQGTTEEKADFANGEVAYLLSQGQNGDVWGQTIGQDAIPNFTGMTVYPVLDCKDEVVDYSNTEGQKLGHSEPEYINNGDTHTIDYPCCDALDVTGQAHTYGDNFHCVCGSVCPNGIFETSNGDLYFVENGTAVKNKGLVQVIDENGLIVYYYFGCGIEGCSAGEACQGNFKAQRSSRHYVGNTNGYLVEGGYTFNADGTIEHFENRQGIQTIEGTKFYLIDGVKVAAGLVEIDGEFYYVRSSGALVIGQDYYVSKPNGLMHNGEEIKKGTYTFDNQGRIDWTLKNGIYAEDGSLYYYVDDVRTYAGLIIYTGDIINADGSVTAGVYNNSMIYVNTKGEVKNNCTYWISKNNGLIEKNRAFTFDANGIVVVVEEKDGFYFENGNWFYYVDGKLNYAGLVWCDGPEGNDPGYYYINSKGMLITGCTYWITKNNGLMQNQAYTFGENGKLVQLTNDSDKLLSGIVEENGEMYYYKNGVRTYAGLIVVDGNYYYVNSEGQIVRNGQYWISRTNGYMKAGSYFFDGDGVLILD